MSTVTKLPIKIQAREIVRHAKRHGLDLSRGGVGQDNRYCARAVIAHAVNLNLGIYASEVNKAVNLTEDEMSSLEDGFEYGYRSYNENAYNSTKYYNVGKRVAELAGL